MCTVMICNHSFCGESSSTTVRFLTTPQIALNICDSCFGKVSELSELLKLIGSAITVSCEHPDPWITWRRNDIQPLTNFPILFLLLKFGLELLQELEVRISQDCPYHDFASVFVETIKQNILLVEGLKDEWVVRRFRTPLYTI